MITINGKITLARDEVGEIPDDLETRLIRSACNRFLTSRGLPISYQDNNFTFSHRALNRSRSQNRKAAK